MCSWQDDNQNYCGGYGVQHGSNRGLCGICGDPWDQLPRQHEAPGGLYATGIITKTYKQGSFIPVIVDITANHQGYFIFKICANNDIFQDPRQRCFDDSPLWVGGGDPKHNYTRYPITDYETGLRMVYVRLPMNVICEQCILQWTYVAGKQSSQSSLRIILSTQCLLFILYQQLVGGWLLLSFLLFSMRQIWRRRPLCVLKAEDLFSAFFSLLHYRQQLGHMRGRNIRYGLWTSRDLPILRRYPDCSSSTLDG